MLLSIVIPTKDRYPCLMETVKALSNMNLPDTEIIIQDNTEDNHDIVKFLRNNTLNRVKYFHTKEPISVNHNADLAITNSLGEYVIFIGDDDAVTTEVIHIIQFMKKSGIDACYSPYARYNWKELVSSARLRNSVEINNECANGDVFIFDASKRLNELMKTTIFDMRIPKVYQGIVSRRVLDMIYYKTHSFFPGPSPDLANAVGVCLLSSKVVQVNSPIIIAGFSKKSASGLGAVNKHVNKIENVPWLDDDVKEKWDIRNPPIWTGQTIWAESLIKALERLGYGKMVRKFNFIRFYSTFIVSHPKLSKYVWQTKGVNKLGLLIDLPIYVSIKALKKMKIKVKNSTANITSSSKRMNIREAIEFVQRYIEKHPVKFQQVKEKQ